MNRVNSRNKRHIRVRKHLSGTAERPRLAVFRSAVHIYAQIIDDIKGVTLVASSDLKTTKKGQTKQDSSYEVGKKLAEVAVKQGIKDVVFDRGGFAYHGRVAKLATGAREGGLNF